MFVGHLATALAAKRVEPRVPLAGLVAASFGLDLLWPLLLLTGIEVVRVEPGSTAFTALAFDSYPWSHSLAMVLLWGAIAGTVTSVVLRSRRAGWLVAAVVVSHWVLDFITHRPDLPLWPGGPLAGLGLWNSIAGTILVEGGMFVAAIALYRRWVRPVDRVGRWAYWGLVGLTGAIWLSGPWSPPPPSAAAVAMVALALWILPFWAEWIERHRAAASATS